MLRNWWMATGGGIIVPAGIIVPYLDTADNIPSGWGQFIAVDGAIKGSIVAGISGAGVEAFGVTTGAAGSHAGGTGFASNMGNASAGGNGRTTYGAVGYHAHGATANYTPQMRKYILIKSVAELKNMPPKTGILSDVIQPDLDDVTDTGSLLAGTNSTAAELVVESKSVGDTPDGGNHHHMNGFGEAPNTGTVVESNASANMGSHSFGAVTVTDNIKRMYLGLWTSATEEIGVVDGMYAMWESATPPDGWSICNGANGTPDLVDYFIGFDVSKLGVQDGDGKITISATTNSKAHRHNWGTNSNGVNEPGLHSNGVGHYHVVNTTVDFDPPHHTLIFIKYTGV